MGFKSVNSSYYNIDAVLKTFQIESKYQLDFVNGVRIEINSTDYNSLKSILKKIGNQYVNESKIIKTFINEGEYFIEFVNGVQMKISESDYNALIAEGGGSEGNRDFSTLQGNLATTDNGIVATYTDEGTILFPIKGSDDIVVDVAQDGQSVIIKLDEDIEAGISKAIEITDVPATATSGTLTEAQLATLQENDTNYIMFNHEKYYTMDKGHSEGFIGYSHIGVENSVFILKNITVTISTRGWSLTTKELQ